MLSLGALPYIRDGEIRKMQGKRSQVPPPPGYAMLLIHASSTPYTLALRPTLVYK